MAGRRSGPGRGSLAGQRRRAPGRRRAAGGAGRSSGRRIGPTVQATGSRRNQAFVWTPDGGAVRVRDKYYLPDEPGYWEASWYDRGEPDFPVARVLDARVGALVCTDLWFFECARHYARSGAELLCLPRATPYQSVGRRVEVTADLDRVGVLCAGRLVAEHERCWARRNSGAGVHFVTPRRKAPTDHPNGSERHVGKVDAETDRALLGQVLEYAAPSGARRRRIRFAQYRPVGFLDLQR